MAKTCPEGTIPHIVCLPKDLHEKVRKLAEYGKADALIVECAREEILRRWAQFIRDEHQKLPLGDISKKTSKTLK